MKPKLLLLSFIEGAVVMAAELCGARLLAPFFGTSLYVWASVLGITLTALAAGYFYGGYLGKNTEKQSRGLTWILITASLFVMLMPLEASYLLPGISTFPFTTGVVTGTLLILFPPIFFLGAASPLFIGIQSTDQSGPARVSGTVYAVSTAGGIISTFICGFWLIPDLGLDNTLYFGGIILLLPTMFIMRKFRLPALIIAMVISILQYRQIRSVEQGKLLLRSDGVMGTMDVEDRKSDGEIIRVLKINDIVQSEMQLDDSSSASAYVGLLNALIPRSGGRALVLGLGAGLTANMLVKKNFDVTGVEFDNRIIDAARDYFFLDKNVRTVCADARYYVNGMVERTRLVLFDLFRAEEQPSHVLSLEGLLRLRQELTDDAEVWINWHGYLKDEKGRGTRILINTLKRAGFNVKAFALTENEDHRNLLFLATTEQRPTMPHEINHEINFEAAPETLVNTDDRPLLEKFNAAANKSWRVNYLRYYHDL